MRIENPTREFAVDEPIFPVVVTEGGEPGALMEVRWRSAEGDVLHREIERVRAGRRNLEFSPPRAVRWPAGQYWIELILDGVASRTERFRVAARVDSSG